MEGMKGLKPLTLQDLPCFRTVRGVLVEAVEVELAMTLSSSSSSSSCSCALLTKEGERKRERGSLRSRELRRWIIPGAFPVSIDEGAPLDLSVVAAAVFGQNGPQWT